MMRMKHIAALAVAMFSFALALALALGAQAATQEQVRAVRHSAGTTEFEGLPQRVIALEYRYVEHLLALNHPPIGVADLEGYKLHVGAAADKLNDTGDVGTRQEPNLEAIALLDPDLIIGVRFRHAAIYDKLKRIAPTLLFDYTDLPADGPRQLDYMRTELKSIATALGKPDAAAAALAGMESQLDEARRRISEAGLENAPVSFGQFLENTPKVRLFSDHSIAIQLLEEIGLENVWRGRFERFGYNVVPVEGLIELGDAHFLHIMYGPTYYDQIVGNPLWRSLPFVRMGRVHKMAAETWPFGGPLSAVAFVDQAVDLLTDGATQ
jgi:ABC-type Fe3+-hydroxamate transport system substrate-binding protein